MWTCPACGEQSEANFGACWNCQADRPEGIDVYEDRRTLPVNCPRCGAGCQHVETSYFHKEEHTLEAYLAGGVKHPPLGARFCLDIYRCQTCGLEFLMDNALGENTRGA
jgi:DNA-directed RNA polymerase subunit RPC12/RpoP